MKTLVMIVGMTALVTGICLLIGKGIYLLWPSLLQMDWWMKGIGICVAIFLICIFIDTVLDKDAY